MTMGRELRKYMTKSCGGKEKKIVFKSYVAVSILVAVAVSTLATMGEVSLNHQDEYCIQPVSTGECQLDYIEVAKLFILPFFLSIIAALILGICFTPVYLAMKWLWQRTRK
ncbi:hypothetical protein ACSEE7_01665 [Halomonas cupida]|uniref:hypothetical protein n=1 Tax=Halomonas cupida TaxID=44933 RepID=UPI003EF6ECCC